MTCSVKNMIWEIFQNSQENTWARVFFKTVTLAQVFSCELREISKTTFSYRTPPEAASEYHWQIFIKPFKVSRSQYNNIYFLYKQSFFVFFFRKQNQKKNCLAGLSHELQMRQNSNNIRMPFPSWESRIISTTTRKRTILFTPF